MALGVNCGGAAKMGRPNRIRSSSSILLISMRWSQEIILVRQIEAVLDLTWIYDELAPHYRLVAVQLIRC